MTNDWSIRRDRKETVTLEDGHDDLISAEVTPLGDGIVRLTFEDGDEITVEASKDMLYEFLAGVINAITNMKE